MTDFPVFGFESGDVSSKISNWEARRNVLNMKIMPAPSGSTEVKSKR